MNADPNEAEQQRDNRLSRERWLRRTQTIVGGTSVGAAIIAARERAKWLAKAPATTQNRMYPLPSIPTAGAQSDLDPSTKPPELPIFPAKPEVNPLDRSSASWIKPIANTTNRASFVPENSGPQEMDCSC
jgi:hypothetical protein